jgi:hypothetical protein
MNRARVIYQSIQTAEGWEVVVTQPGQPLRLLDRAQSMPDLARTILTDYLGDASRADDLAPEFAALSMRQFTEPWRLDGADIERWITEVEILRAKWCRLLMRG